MNKEPLDLVADARAEADTAKTDRLEETFSSRKQRLGEYSLDHWKAANSIYTIDAAADVIEELRERLARCRQRELEVANRYETLLREITTREVSACIAACSDVEMEYLPGFDKIVFSSPPAKVILDRPRGFNVLTSREGAHWVKRVADQFSETFARSIYALLRTGYRP